MMTAAATARQLSAHRGQWEPDMDRKDPDGIEIREDQGNKQTNKQTDKKKKTQGTSTHLFFLVPLLLLF